MSELESTCPFAQPRGAVADDVQAPEPGQPDSRQFRPTGIESIRSRSGPILQLGAIAALSFAAHIAIGAAVHGPFVFMDELGYERSAWSLAQSGRIELFGQPGLAYSPLYSILLAPLYALTSDAARAYEWVKVVNALLISLSVVPVYLISRSLLTRRAAVAVAALGTLAPLTMYASLEMSENLAYPLFLLAVWAMLRTIRLASLRNDGLLLALILAASAARLQAVVLAPAAATAILLTGALRRRAHAEHTSAALRKTLVEHRLFFVVVFLAAVVASARTMSNGGALPLAGRYANVGNAQASPVHVADVAVQHLAGLDLAVGVAPFAAALLAAYALFRRRFPRGGLVFAAVASSVTLWLLVEVAFDAAAFDGEPGQRVNRATSLPPDLPRVHERYLIYLVPFFLVAFVAVLRRPRPRFAAVLVAGVAAALLPGIIPFGRDINNSIVVDSFALQVFGVSAGGRPIQPIAHATTTAVVIAAVLSGLFAIALLGRRRRLAFASTAVVLTLMSGIVWVRLHAAAHGSTFNGLPAHADWVDSVVHNSDAVLVGGAGVPRVGLLQTAFYNLTVDRIYFTCTVAFGSDFGEQRLTLGDAGALRLGSYELRAKYAVVPSRFRVRGRVLARNSKGGLVVVALAGGKLVVAPAARRSARCGS